MKKKIALLISGFIGCCLFVQDVKGQENDTLAFNQSLIRLQHFGDSLLKGKSDQARLIGHEQFSLLADSILRNPVSWKMSFYQVPALSVLTSSDEKFKIYNWMLTEKDGNAFSYFCYIQLQDPKTKVIQLIHLHEKKVENNEEVELLKLDSAAWMGAVYYKIIHQHKKKKDYYLLLGWAPHTSTTTRKIIEPLLISAGKVVFGAPVLKTGGKAKMRMVFEYNSQATMLLRFNENQNMVVFDHLSSSDPRPEAKNVYSLYGPDLSYDGLKFSKGLWYLQKDIDVKNQNNTDGKQPEVKKLRITRKQD